MFPYSTTPFRVFNGKRRNNGRRLSGGGSWLEKIK